MPRAALFDLDGTLVDSLADIAAAMNHALAGLGLPTHPVAAYRSFVGEGVEQLVRRALPPGRDTLYGTLSERYLARYEEVLLDQTVAYPGISELLDALVARGVALAVLSNKPDRSTQRIVAKLFARWPFAAVAGRRPEVPRKPDPTGALEVATQLAVPPRECAFIGDTAIDMQTAVAAGMVPLGCAWGFRPEELLQAGACILARTPIDVLQAF
jgi:phosphoglycolate phosphatase